MEGPSLVWVEINKLRERVTTVEGNVRSHAKENERLAGSIDHLTQRFDSAIRLGYGLLGGLIVNLLLMIVELTRRGP